MSSAPLLTEPIVARLDGQAVLILDADERSVLIEHSMSDLDVAVDHHLQFTWEGETIDVRCRLGTSILQDLLSDRLEQLTWHARAAVDTATDPAPFQRALAAYRMRIDDAQRANLVGDLEGEPASAVMVGAGKALRQHKPGFRAFILRGGGWTSRPTRSPEQPLDGFTVAEYEDEQQVAILKLAFEEADREGRDLIRKFAAASLE